MTETPSDNYLRALVRGLSVIRSFGAERPEMTLSEVAERTGLTRANARRILLTLETLGYVELRERLFRLRPRILDLGYAYLSSLDLAAYVQPIIEDLVARVQEPCNVALLDGKEIIYVARVSTRRADDIGISINIGRRFPAWVTSMGRQLLGGLTPAEFDAYLADLTIERFTPRTVPDLAALRRIVAEDRAKGWSYVDGEQRDHVATIAAPVKDGGGRVVAAMGIGWFARASENERRRAELLPELLAAAEAATRSMALKR